MNSPLYNRLKAARAPSRQLDREIFRRISGRTWFVPRYTRHFEAALTILPRLVYVEVSGGTDTGQEGVWPAVSIRWLRPGETDTKKWMGTVQGASTFALAMCLAAIEVRDRMEKSE